MAIELADRLSTHGARMWRVLERQGLADHKGVRLNALMRLQEARLPPEQVISRATLANIFYRGADPSLDVVLAMARTLRTDVRHFLLDPKPHPELRRHDPGPEASPLDELNALMPIDERHEGAKERRRKAKAKGK